jgi:hypothetical protein
MKTIVLLLLIALMVIGVMLLIEKYNKNNDKINRILLISSYIERLYQAKNLHSILTLHKKLWSDGIQNANIGPCDYGMFRTKDIIDMTEDEVFLGNINGLWTKPMRFWLDRDEEPIVLEQYRQHLISNLKAIRNSI